MSGLPVSRPFAFENGKVIGDAEPVAACEATHLGEPLSQERLVLARVSDVPPAVEGENSSGDERLALSEAGIDGHEPASGAQRAPHQCQPGTDFFVRETMPNVAIAVGDSRQRPQRFHAAGTSDRLFRLMRLAVTVMDHQVLKERADALSLP